ncbi:MAG: lasso peptide biosynthesis B2 protein [Candidatus Eremiobacteraeota bacterium]|nr:lasso peptide biosynthesis B2 protein [Candidatus Eremiobacteraeota bacterium]
MTLDLHAPLPRPGRSIRYANVDGLQVVLDLTSASYYVLDDVASAMWSVVTERSDIESALVELASSFGVERERLRGNFDRFVTDCVARGFLEFPAPPVPVLRRAPAVRPAVVPSSGLLLAALAWRSLIETRASLARQGFRAVYERCASLPLTVPGAGLERAAAAFRRAENFSISRHAPDDCLPRSLALYRFLRLAGIPATHVIGVTRIPFQAHAWVEFGGHPVLDDSPVRAGMTPLARLPATG